MKATRWFAVWMLAGCAPGEILLDARVQGSVEDAVALAGAKVELRDDDFELVDEGVTDENGQILLAAPRQAEIHVVVRADGAVPAVFRGESGKRDRFEVPDGVLWAVPQTELDSWRATFAGCPGAADPGRAVIGTLRVAAAVIDPHSAAIASQGFAYTSSVDDLQEDRRDACYLDAAGEAYDEAAQVAGPVGRFAIFDVPVGPSTLTMGRFVTGGTSLGRTTLFVPEGGVASLQPALVPL